MTDPAAVRGNVDVEAPPIGTAVVRPLRHVYAVRRRHSEQLVGQAVGGNSRSARAWCWALGETAIAPVTDRVTAAPPSRAEIEAEIAEADEQRLRRDRESRADGAATILRWLVGQDDHVPVRGANRGELVDGFGEVVRSPGQIADAIGGLTQDAVGSDDYRGGALASLSWISDRSSRAPISGTVASHLTTRDLKAERLYAEDVMEQSEHRPAVGSTFSGDYGLGVKRAIDWLLGDSTSDPFCCS